MKGLATIATLLVLACVPGRAFAGKPAEKAPPAKAAAAKGATGKPAEVQLSAESFRRVFSKMGIEHKLEKDSEGELAVFYKNGGYNVGLFLYRGAGGAIDSYQFQAGFDTEAANLEQRIADWNRTKRFGRAVVREDGDPEIRYDVLIAGCGFGEQLEAEVELFQVFLVEFGQHVASE